MRNKHTAALFTAAVIAVSAAFSGCGSPAGNTVRSAPSAAAREIADEYYPSSRADFPEWAGIDSSKVVGSVNSPEHIPELDITYGEFIDEYMYYLAVSGITDDMSAEFADTCAAYRLNIINYLTYEKMYMYAAKQDYNISPETLTPEQLAEVRSSADAVRDDWKTEFYAAASAKLGKGASDEDIDRLCGEALDVIFEKCGIDYDMFYNWELYSKIEALVYSKMLEGSEITDEQVQRELQGYIDSAKLACENDPASYETNPTYIMAYVPDGTRCASHIFIPAGDTAKADEVSAKIKEMGDGLTDEAFSTLIKQYGGATEHMVLRNSAKYASAYVSALYDLGKKYGVSEPVVSDDGVYFIMYTGDAVAETELLESNIKSRLKTQTQENVQFSAYQEWNSKYSFDIDCETLRVSQEDIIQSRSQ